MNCQEGDMAIVVKATQKHHEVLLGKIRKVTHIVGYGGYGNPCWAYEGARFINGNGKEILGLADCALRPIRPEADPVTTDVVAGVEA